MRVHKIVTLGRGLSVLSGNFKDGVSWDVVQQMSSRSVSEPGREHCIWSACVSRLSTQNLMCKLCTAVQGHQYIRSLTQY